MLPQRKTIRLNKSCYEELYRPCSLTLTTKNRVSVFGSQNDTFTKECLHLVRSMAEQNTKDIIPIHVVLFMPDHIHLCIEASQNKNIVEFIAEMKSRSIVLAKQNNSRLFWQRSFFDHFLRKEDDLVTVVRYILQNPVRKNLTENWFEYPYWYSNRYTSEELSVEF